MNMARDDSEPRSDDPGPIETGPVTKGTRSGISTGKIRGSGIVTGPGSSAQVTNQSDVPLNAVLAELHTFLDLLAVHEAPDSDEIREAVGAVEQELISQRRSAVVIRSLLDRIAALLSGYAALTEQISKVQAMVSHLL
jgi:hypothetical protein